ncbi:diguanylate cyclase [Clostridiaceae bacterium UIB06]|uniref:Diguanylate cyclase n=1 Tax=Clostridium thailandense TaxID=2794346 RepID=A0A949X1R8_9CLOT|nr:diguanylate cyclase [Clostridium thailandense]MBV7272419.1 diguanylate cyclase [Clostridium thailandense]MCH5136943.1 diguanylate cyclase [Clostridiaceae bacterium UIB06]
MFENVKILVVEDSITQAEKLKFTLESNNYKVIIANDGLQALEYIDRFMPGLVITDILMPKMDGYQLCKKIKEDNRFKHIPVILLTALSDPIDVITGLKAKADNFITKPYNESFLLSRIQHMLINMELRKSKVSEIGIEVFFAGEKHFINSERIQIVDLLLSTFDNAVQKTKELQNANNELKKAFDTIKRLEKNYRTALESNMDALVILNYDKEIFYLNSAAKRLFGENYRDLIFDIVDFNSIEKCVKEVVINCANGSSIIGEVCISDTDWEGRDAYLLSVRDITEKAELRERLKIQSVTDELTALYNRRGFFNLAEYKLNFAKRNKKGMLLFFIDIDGMKYINDNLSHHEGDLTLEGASTILRETFNDQDVIARIGGDEFAVLSMNAEEADIPKLTTKLLNKQREFNSTKKYSFNISMSIGAAYFHPESVTTINELMSKADRLMYENKNQKSRGEDYILQNKKSL